MHYEGLDEAARQLVQRFTPCLQQQPSSMKTHAVQREAAEQAQVDAPNSTNNAAAALSPADTIGFFVAKFVKTHTIFTQECDE